MKFKRSLATLCVSLSLCSSALATITLVDGYFNSIKVSANQTAPSTINIDVHKTQYDESDKSYWELTSSKLINWGTEIQNLPHGLLNYNPSVYGKIEFTLYDITDAVNAHYTDGKGLVKFTDKQQDELNERISEIIQSIKKGDSEYTSGSNVQKVATQAVGADGSTTFENVKAYDASKPQKYHYYAVVETKTPKGFVNQKADPLVVVAPYTNPEGNDYLSTVHVYPKNETKKLTFKLTKYAEDNSTDGTSDPDEKSPLAGAKFDLYKGEVGKGEVILKDLVADEKGVVTATDLIMGSYYFVEKPSENVSNDGMDGKGYQISPIAKNDANNKLSFTIDENGATETDLSGYLINYTRPDITKKLTNGIGDTHSLHIGDAASFESKVTVPRNIMGSGWSIGADSTMVASAPYHEFNTVDQPQKYLKDVPELRNLVIKTPDGDTLTEGQDYVIIQGPNFWGVDFITQDLNETDKANLKTTVGSFDEYKQMMASKTSGHVTDKVAKYEGKQLTYTYDQYVTSDAPMDTDIVNYIDLNWNDGSGHNEIRRKDKTITYGVHFIKETSGFMGSNVGAEPLEGAKFAVQDKRTGKWFNGFKAADSTKSGEVEAQWVDSYKDVDDGLLTSGKDGTFALQGFSEGDYLIREVQAPQGYQLMNETVDFTIGPKSDAETLKAPIRLKNDAKPNIPLTGSDQLLIAGGVAIVVMATTTGFAIYVKRKYA